MADPKQEEAYWREQHQKQLFAKPGQKYDEYAAAYRAGYEGFHKYPGKPYEEIEDDLALDYERSKAGAALPWDHARHAVRAAWAKLSNAIGPRDPDRGIRSGFEMLVAAWLCRGARRHCDTATERRGYSNSR